jgi:hypothetical protein
MPWSSRRFLVWKRVFCRIHNWLGVGRSGANDTTLLSIEMYVHVAALEEGLESCQELARTFRAVR